MPKISCFFILVSIFSCFSTPNDNRIVLAVFLCNLESFGVLQRGTVVVKQ